MRIRIARSETTGRVGSRAHLVTIDGRAVGELVAVGHSWLNWYYYTYYTAAGSELDYPELVSASGRTMAQALRLGFARMIR